MVGALLRSFSASLLPAGRIVALALAVPHGRVLLGAPLGSPVAWCVPWGWVWGILGVPGMALGLLLFAGSAVPPLLPCMAVRRHSVLSWDLSLECPLVGCSVLLRV